MSVGCNYCGRHIPDAEPHVCTRVEPAAPRATFLPPVYQLGGAAFQPDDTLAAAGDDLRDVIDRDLIVDNPPAADWRPDEKDLA